MARPGDDPAERPQRGPGCLFVAAVVLAALGALVLPAYGVLMQMASDACGDEETYFCTGDGQIMAIRVAFLAGPGALVAAFLATVVLKRLRQTWPYWVLGAEVLGAVAVTAIASQV